MKKIVSLTSVFILVLIINSYGQQQTSLSVQGRQRWEQRGDSAIADREVQRMKQVFTVTAEQEQALFKAGITISRSRRTAFKTYGNTDAYATQRARVDSLADALYTSIVGEANYSKYKDALHSRLVQPQRAMFQQAGTDSLNPKSQQP